MNMPNAGHSWRTKAAALLTAAVLLLGACGTSTAAPEITLVSVSEASQVVADAPAGLVVLDVRTPEEYNQGHLAGAINVDFYADDFSAQLDRLDKAVPYVLYCKSGNRSGQTAPIMTSLGFDEVYEIEGGVDAWIAAGEPLEQ
jgi:rhodanese-related sulfurtransferase